MVRHCAYGEFRKENSDILAITTGDGGSKYTWHIPVEAVGVESLESLLLVAVAQRHIRTLSSKAVVGPQ
jgi:hypothetical protein